MLRNNKTYNCTVIPWDFFFWSKEGWTWYVCVFLQAFGTRRPRALETGPPGMGQVTVHSWGLLPYNPFPLIPSVPRSIKEVSAGQPAINQHQKSRKNSPVKRRDKTCYDYRTVTAPWVRSRIAGGKWDSFSFKGCNSELRGNVLNLWEAEAWWGAYVTWQHPKWHLGPRLQTGRRREEKMSSHDSEKSRWESQLLWKRILIFRKEFRQRDLRLQLHLFSSSSLFIFLLHPPSFSRLLLVLNEIGVVLRRGQRTLRGRHLL